MKTEHCGQTELFAANNDPECSFERPDLLVGLWVNPTFRVIL